MGFGLDVIEYADATNRSVVARIPESGAGDIPYGAQLIVHQNQEAVFFRDGKAMDVFGPGRHTLTSANIPLLSRLLTLPWRRTPFRALVYFVGKQTFVDQKWGTQQPIIFKDNTFGLVRLRSYGKYSFRVADSTVLINTLVGTQGLYSTDDVTRQLRDVIVARMNDLLGTMQLDVVQLPAKFDEIASATRAKVAEEFSKYGLELVDFYVNAISPPEEVQQAIDARAGQVGSGNLVSATTAHAHQPATGNKSSADARSLVKKAAAENHWSITERDDHWSIVVPIGPLRRQEVMARFDRKDSAGHDLISFTSVCGPAMEETATTMLRYNGQLVHAAFAIHPSPAGEVFVLTANQLTATADELEISRAITSVAWQADQVEQQLGGGGDLH
jgi:membrane protease subunit (stomatin/prohibitin family)